MSLAVEINSIMSYPFHQLLLLALILREFEVFQTSVQREELIISAYLTQDAAVNVVKVPYRIVIRLNY